MWQTDIQRALEIYFKQNPMRRCIWKVEGNFIYPDVRFPEKKISFHELFASESESELPAINPAVSI